VDRTSAPSCPQACRPWSVTAIRPFGLWRVRTAQDGRARESRECRGSPLNPCRWRRSSAQVGAETTAQLVWILAPRLPEPEGMAEASSRHRPLGATPTSTSSGPRTGRREEGRVTRPGSRRRAGPGVGPGACRGPRPPRPRPTTSPSGQGGGSDTHKHSGALTRSRTARSSRPTALLPGHLPAQRVQAQINQRVAAGVMLHMRQSEQRP